jgi:predicted amidophosphoribosyltransferase
MYCGHEHLKLDGRFYICDVCGAYFEALEIDTDSIASCVECGEEFEQNTDLQICEMCLDEFDTDRLWQDHDNNVIDALDFNESAVIREKYRLKEGK